MKLLLTFFSVALAMQTASAAMITFEGRTELSASNPQFNLTDLGTTDWAYWDTNANPASGVATNDMSGGFGIGSISGTGGTSTVRGTGTSNTTADFSFTNGSGTASGTASNITGLFNTTLTTSGYGVQLGFTLADPGQEYTINVWTAGFATEEATVVGSLTGATSYNSGSVGGFGTAPQAGFYGDSIAPKEQYLYTFTVTPDSANDVFTFSIQTSGSNSTNQHVLISAATISAVPEPSSIALVVFALSALVFLRRR